MTFCRWYPLIDAAAHVSARPGILQLRVLRGLVDYPQGKSAMVHYTLAQDMLVTAAELAAQYRDQELLCRHVDATSAGDAQELSAAFDTLLSRFRTRFGIEPRLPG